MNVILTTVTVSERGVSACYALEFVVAGEWVGHWNEAKERESHRMKSLFRVELSLPLEFFGSYNLLSNESFWTSFSIATHIYGFYQKRSREWKRGGEKEMMKFIGFCTPG